MGYIGPFRGVLRSHTRYKQLFSSPNLSPALCYSCRLGSDSATVPVGCPEKKVQPVPSWKLLGFPVMMLISEQLYDTWCSLT